MNRLERIYRKQVALPIRTSLTYRSSSRLPAADGVARVKFIMRSLPCRCSWRQAHRMPGMWWRRKARPCWATVPIRHRTSLQQATWKAAKVRRSSTRFYIAPHPQPSDGAINGAISKNASLARPATAKRDLRLMVVPHSFATPSAFNAPTPQCRPSFAETPPAAGDPK
jgi:hypothetical protein